MINQQHADYKSINELKRMSKAGKEASKAGEKLAVICKECSELKFK